MYYTQIIINGRIDIAIKFIDKIYIIELKCNQNASRALKQIKDKKYADKYLALVPEIYLIGINFDTSAREITDWSLEKLITTS